MLTLAKEKSIPAQSALENLFMPVAFISTEGTILYFNKAAREITGRKSIVGGESFFDVLEPANIESWENLLENVEFGKALNFNAFTNPGKRKVAISITKVEIENIIYLQATISDRTSEIISHDDKISQREKYRAIFENFAPFLGLLTNKGVLVDANQGSTNFVGSLFSDSIGKFLWDSEIWKYSSVESNNVRNKVISALSGAEEVFETEIDNNGVFKGFLEFKLKAVSNAENGIDYIIVEGRDITEQKSTQSLQRKTEELYKTLANTIPFGVFFLFDKDLSIILAEGNGLELLNMNQENLTGKKLDDLPLCQNWANKFVEMTKKNEFTTEATSELGHTFQWTILEPTENRGYGIMVGFNVDNVKDAEDNYNRKIHELNLLNNQLKIENGVRQLIQKNLQEQTRELELKNQELEQFAYVASHDLQEPLRMVSSYTQLLANKYREKLDDDALEFITYAIEGATRMQNLINDLLQYSRIGRKEMNFERINLEVILQLVRQNLSVLIEETGATINSGPMPFVEADASQMVQLFQNLISNAIKFRTSGTLPVIDITATPKDRQYEISITDNGIGLSMEYKDRIFQIFQRLHTRDKYPGTGIGLAICKKIVERHGGQIWVESKIGKGTVFSFTLNTGITE